MFMQVLRLSQEERRDLLQEKKNLLSVRAVHGLHLTSPPYNKKNSFYIPLFRYFYNHLNNYTETIVRLRLMNIGACSLLLRRIIVK